LAGVSLPSSTAIRPGGSNSLGMDVAGLGLLPREKPQGTAWQGSPWGLQALTKYSPGGGQGMKTGIGDGVNLAWKLAGVLNGGGRDSLLATYEPERIGFARRLVATTDRGFTLVTKQGVVARWVRTRLVPLIAPLLFRLAPVRRFLFRTV